VSGRSPDGPDRIAQRDSAGQAWVGRSLTSTGFDRDDGSADPALRRVMQHPADEERLMRALSIARLLVPVVARARDVARTPGALSGPSPGRSLGADTSSDMASVTVTSPDGQRGLPAFTDAALLAAWDPAARPVPVTAARAAQAAVSERCEVMVLDLGSARSVVLRPSMVWALAQQRAWAPAHEDPFVLAAVRRAAAPENDVAAVAVEPGEPAGAGVLRVALSVRPGLQARAVEALATRVGERIAADGETRARIDALRFAIRPA